MYNILKGKHPASMSDLKSSERYLFLEAKNINIDLALLALKGMDRDNRNMFDFKSKNNDGNYKKCGNDLMG
ncbi:hypothetical protein PFDG_05175 [Plasmodium falciparum Dd2]|uniref:Uncharacterized protein n=1 Tax=Plasmodium falciparum (isolate Dd2) TaxID=57267 RepID=A0A0L7M9X7_PLAF4|nr:hypothetical protein PFDG_05175 [Plasmodium falciparum Dd2]